MRGTLYVAATLAAGVLTFPSGAHAIGPGWCGTAEEVSALMRDQGQRVLMQAQRIPYETLPDGSYRSTRDAVGLMFTADEQGRVGYLIQSDQPMGTPATSGCVTLRYHDVRLYDARQPGVPNDVLVNSTPQAAAARCEQLHRETCVFLNEALERIDSTGERVAIQAYTVRELDDGRFVNGSEMITVTLTMPGNGLTLDGERYPDGDQLGTLVFSTLPEGATSIAEVFRDGAYTERALAILDSRLAAAE